jgi:hypothetical protein
MGIGDRQFLLSRWMGLKIEDNRLLNYQYYTGKFPQLQAPRGKRQTEAKVTAKLVATGVARYNEIDC